MSILERVKTLCDQSGMSIAELERKADLGNGSVRRWGDSIPAADKLQRAAKILGTSMEYLLDGEEIDSGLENPKILLMARNASDLPDDQIDLVNGIIDNFKKNKMGG